MDLGAIFGNKKQQAGLLLREDGSLEKKKLPSAGLTVQDEKNFQAWNLNHKLLFDCKRWKQRLLFFDQLGGDPPDIFNHLNDADRANMNDLQAAADEASGQAIATANKKGYQDKIATAFLICCSMLFGTAAIVVFYLMFTGRLHG